MPDKLKINSIGVRARGQRVRVQTKFDQPSLTKQADLKRANIHEILKRASNTGLIPVNSATPLDNTKVLPDVESYHEAVNTVLEAKTTFDNIPSHIRQKFDNDPAKFLEFIADPENQAELVELGLADSTNAPPAENTSQEASEGQEAGATEGGGRSAAEGEQNAA